MNKTCTALAAAALIAGTCACGATSGIYDGLTDESTQVAPKTPGPVTPLPHATANGAIDLPNGVSKFTVDVDGRKVPCIYVDNGSDGGLSCNWAAQQGGAAK